MTNSSLEDGVKDNASGHKSGGTTIAKKKPYKKPTLRYHGKSYSGFHIR